MSVPVLYYSPLSPPSRFAWLLTKLIELDVELKRLDLMKGEHLTKEFIAINPTSTVPALVDGNVKIFDSNAICIYLMEKYAKGNPMYPEDIELRTKIHERLFYVASYMFPRGYQIIFRAFLGISTSADLSEYTTEEMLRGYGNIERFLTGNDYLTGSTLTLCDLSLWCLMESGIHLLAIDEKKFPNFSQWLERMRELPVASLNRESGEAHYALYLKCLERNIAKAAK